MPKVGLPRYAVVFCLVALAPAQQAALDQLYQEVLRPPLAQSAVVENVTFELDGMTFHLASGQLALSKPVDGQPVAAVFAGVGQLAVPPANPIERQQIQRLRNGATTIAENFTQAVFRFPSSDEFLLALKDQAHFRPLETEGLLGKILDDRSELSRKLGRPESARVLLALRSMNAVAGLQRKLFYAELLTGDADWIEAENDPLRTESARVHAWSIHGVYLHDWNELPHQLVGPGIGHRAFPNKAGFDDTWTEFQPTGEPPPPDTPGIAAYRITLPLQASNGSRRFDTAMRITAPQSGWRGLFLRLDSNFRLRAATLAGAPIAWLQPPDPYQPSVPIPVGEGGETQYEGNWIYLELPQPMAAGQPVEIALQYDNPLVLGMPFADNVAWYPLNPFGEALHPAAFAMDMAVLPTQRMWATGRTVWDAPQSNSHTARTATPAPLPDFGLVLLGRLHSARISVPVDGGRRLPLVGVMDGYKSSFENWMTLCMDAFAFMDHTLGPYPYPRLTIASVETGASAYDPVTEAGGGSIDWVSNIPARTGDSIGGMPGSGVLGDRPSWPMLSEVVAGYGNGWMPNADGLRLLTDIFPAHAIAHQWFGNSVGFAGYHDQWLSEGFSNAAALLFEEHEFGEANAMKTLSYWRRELLARNAYGQISEQDGPLWLGRRLDTSLDPLGYDIVAYDKGAYVLYMLRQLMMDSAAPNPDARFIAMMHDYTATYAGRNAATEDFKAIAEKHMTPEMDLDGNRKLDWFFNQYVYGTGVPRIQFRAGASAAADGKGYSVALSADNPGHWRGLLPVYIYRDQTHYIRGEMRIEGDHPSATLHIDFSPVQIEANHFQDMLLDVSQ